MALYPLRFDPIFKSMLWGGRRLPSFLNRATPHADPVGEAWVVSDVDGHESRVSEGRQAGTSLRELIERHGRDLLGPAHAHHRRFPLLLKFIDARQELSVQVHPNDEQAARVAPGLAGKTEAWVILDACPNTSKIYAGVRDGVTAEQFRSAIQSRSTPGLLHSFSPRAGDCVFLDAGTVHAIGANVLLFEVQQTSDITYRLYDWDRLDSKTGLPRQLHIEEGLACADFARGRCDPVRPHRENRGSVVSEELVNCGYFTLGRHTGSVPFSVGAAGSCRLIVCIDGDGELESQGDHYALSRGDVFLLPAAIGACRCLPRQPMVLLECGLPESGNASRSQRRSG